MFGFTEEQISSIFLPFGIVVVMLFAMLMTRELAIKSRTGKIGVVILILAMALSQSGFVVKALVHFWLEE